jgi:Protein of unknown function (DUF2877)
VTCRVVPSAASFLLSGLFDATVAGADVPLIEAARTHVSVHYETGDASLPVLAVVAPSAVRLPNSVVTSVLPGEDALVVSAGALHGDSVWRVTRWWRPPRPRGVVPPATVLHFDLPPLGVPLPRPSYDGLVPVELVGAGPGLTPAGDDVLAGALVTAHATADPRLSRWRNETRAALETVSTTVVSRGLLQHAMDGYATDQLADFLTALCSGKDPSAARDRLLAVGHSSGAALLAGVVYALNTRDRRATQGAA